MALGEGEADEDTDGRGSKPGIVPAMGAAAGGGRDNHAVNAEVAQEGRWAVLIGAGMVGAGCALALMPDGWRVTVLEPGNEQAASHGNGAWLSPASVAPMSMPERWTNVPGHVLDRDGPLVIRWRALPQSERGDSAPLRSRGLFHVFRQRLDAARNGSPLDGLAHRRTSYPSSAMSRRPLYKSAMPRTNKCRPMKSAGAGIKWVSTRCLTWACCAMRARASVSAW